MVRLRGRREGEEGEEGKDNDDRVQLETKVRNWNLPFRRFAAFQGPAKQSPRLRRPDREVLPATPEKKCA